MTTYNFFFELRWTAHGTYWLNGITINLVQRLAEQFSVKAHKHELKLGILDLKLGG